MEQALSAIMTNALQSGGSEVSIRSRTVSGEDGDLFAEIVVDDNGEGISRQMQEKLFTVFATSKSDGTGLGLAQAKKVIGLHGGEIIVSSTAGEGTEILIKIPIVKHSSIGFISEKSKTEEQG